RRAGGRKRRLMPLAAAPVPLPPSGPQLAVGDGVHVWAGGAGGVFASRDGGSTWTLRSRAPVDALAAWGARRAWYSSQGVLWRTSDGGRHWRHLAVPHLLSFRFVGGARGFGLDRG